MFFFKRDSKLHVGALGFEPRLNPPHGLVLPLHYAPYDHTVPPDPTLLKPSVLIFPPREEPKFSAENLPYVFANVFLHLVQSFTRSPEANLVHCRLGF